MINCDTCLPSICSISCNIIIHNIHETPLWPLHSILSLLIVIGLEGYRAFKLKSLCVLHTYKTFSRLQYVSHMAAWTQQSTFKIIDGLPWEMSNWSASKAQHHELALTFGVVKPTFTCTRRFIKNVKSGQLGCWLKMRQTCKLRTLDPHFLWLRKVWDIFVKNLKIQTN